MDSKEIKDEYEPSPKLIKIIQLSKNGIKLNLEPIEIVNLRAEDEKKETKVGTKREKKKKIRL